MQGDEATSPNLHKGTTIPGVLSRERDTGAQCVLSSLSMGNPESHAVLSSIGHRAIPRYGT